MFIISDLRESRESALQLVLLSLLIVWNVVVTIALSVFVFGWWSISPELLGAVRDAEHRSVLTAAAQLGRLDIVSLLFAIFGILAGFGAIFGIIEVRKNAEINATQTAKEKAEEWMSTNAPQIVSEYMDFISPMDSVGIDGGQNSKADKIAEKSGDENGST